MCYTEATAYDSTHQKEAPGKEGYFPQGAQPNRGNEKKSPSKRATKKASEPGDQESEQSERQRKRANGETRKITDNKGDHDNQYPTNIICQQSHPL